MRDIPGELFIINLYTYEFRDGIIDYLWDQKIPKLSIESGPRLNPMQNE